jgi:hypothetical protein
MVFINCGTFQTV